jgi:hypothetical protein
MLMDVQIELNPMVIEHRPIKTPRDAPADEFLDCAWQELTDKVHYLPGGLVKGKVSYKACFHDLPTGLQTHIYAPTGLDIREKWSIQGSLPGEPPERRELGSTAPAVGLYLKEECEMRCNRFLNSFVRKNLDEAHRILVERIMKKAEMIEARRGTGSAHSNLLSPTAEYFNRNPPEQAYGNGFQVGSHMSHSKILQSPTIQSPQTISPQTRMPHTISLNGISPQKSTPQTITAQQYHYPQPQSGNVPPNLADHPAFRNDRPLTHNITPTIHNRSWSTANTTETSASNYTSHTQASSNTGASNHTPSRPQHYQHASMSAFPPAPPSKQFIAELPGSIPQQKPQPSPQFRRHSLLSDLSDDIAPGGTDRASVVSALDLGSNVVISPVTHVQNGDQYQQLPQTRYQYNPMDFQRR